MRIITDSTFIELSLKELFRQRNIPLSEDFKEVLLGKYLQRLVFPKSRRRYSKKQQCNFLDFLVSAEDLEIQSITVNTANRSYTCKTDNDVLTEFDNVFIDLKNRFFKSTYNDNGELVRTEQIRFFLERQTSHTFKPRVERLKRSLERYLQRINLKMKDRKLHILIYDLLSIVFIDDFTQNDSTNILKKRKFDQAKAARISKILK